MPRATTYWETLRHLRPVQFYGRFWYKFFRPPIDRSSAPPVSRHEGLWAGSISRSPSMEGPVQFRFLNHVHTLPDKGGWEERSLERLWLYNLHYFDDLNAEDAGERTKWHRDLINRWMVENGPGEGTGWESYPTSLRIVNWIKWALTGNSLESEWLHSLAIQTRWLRRRLEWHLMGNHLLENAKALIFAGSYFKGLEADGWLKKGLQILDREIPEQVLEDGGHFELSPMYHSIILEDILDLVNVAQTWPGKFPNSIVRVWRSTAEKMLEWLAALTHPDGQIAFFNDAAFGIAGTPDSLRDYAMRLSVDSPNHEQGTVCSLVSSGYVRISQGDAVVLLDVASIGPDYLPGHAHADTLSFEFSLFGQRILVNSGTSLYEQGKERLRQRGTAAHNTVQIDRENSSEVWSSFRVARRAKPFDLVFDRIGDGWSLVTCSHDGYKRLAGQNIHRRQWKLQSKQLDVIDKIDGPFRAAVSRFYLHPDVSVEGRCLHIPDGRKIRFNSKGARIDIIESTWHPEFGKTMKSQCLELEFQFSEASLTLTWD